MLISVVIPSWNGWKFLPTCLDSLRRQTFRSFEVIVVDNGSTDGSADKLREHYPEVRVIALPNNRMFSGGVNEGIRHARGDVIALLNNDTQAEPRWLEELARALEAHPEVGFCASKLLLFDRRTVLHSAGDFYGEDGVPGNRGVWREDDGKYDVEEYVFGACAGAAAYRRSMLDDIGLLDEDLVAYCEDVDLNFRAQLAGYRCLFVPTARVYHHLSATGGGPFASYYCGRNFISVIVKDMPGEILRRYWPRIVLRQLRYAAGSLWRFREPSARARLRGQLAGLGQLPKMRVKRKTVQQGRRVSIEYIKSVLTLPR